MSGLHCITFRICIIWFNSNSALAEMLQLVKWRTPAGRLHFDSQQGLLLNLTTYQQDLRHTFTNLLDSVKPSPSGRSEEVKQSKWTYLKQSITTYHFKEHKLIKQKDVTFPFHSSSTTSYMVSSPVTCLEWPRRFQEVKVPRFHDNGTGWW
jgi:hypothetical protein